MEDDSGGSIMKELRQILDTQDLTKEKRQHFLNLLARLFLQPMFTEDICKLCGSIILDVVARSKDFVGHQSSEDKRRKHFQRLCIALSNAVERCPDLQGKFWTVTSKKPNNVMIKHSLWVKRKCHTRFIAEYLSDQDSFLCCSDKLKNDKLATSLSRSAWNFVRILGNRIDKCITLQSLLDFLTKNQNNQDVIWFCTKAIAEKLSMTLEQWQNYISSYVADSLSVFQLQLRHEREDVGSRMVSRGLSSAVRNLPVEKIQNVIQDLDPSDLHKEVVSVTGILLPKIDSKENKHVIPVPCLIPVPSMLSNLRSLSLAVAVGNPVLLQGPVGCGKTTLVEHLAALTGRLASPHLMKIQLGDQTDSKALLGTYRCTEIPGEFVWQPGILTRAVTEGHWVLLEDIDYAPMDVVSVLLPLLERNVLSLPGHGDNLQAAPGFRLFATQRLLGSSSGWHRQQSGSSMLLEKMWTKINVESLGREELQQVITTKFPQLTTVTERLLDIYFMVSAGKHELYGENVEDSETTGKYVSHDGRLISTRDLMSWCGRIAVDFDITSTATANVVLQEALDCFIACIPNPQKRIQLAEIIGAKLNITKVKSEYYCCKYKPPIMVSPTTFSVGRIKLAKIDNIQNQQSKMSSFSFTHQASILLERIAVCISNMEPVLLVGETGTGKTSTVQYLAQQLGHKLCVINMNQQSDSTDLLGGFKPMDLRHVVKPFREEFEVLFCETFSRAENSKFLNHIQDCYTQKKWGTLFTLMEHTIGPALKRKDSSKRNQWLEIKRRLKQLRIQVQQSENVLAFSFVEGTLVKALKRGDWVLLDEINLAAAETLECLSGLLESQGGSVVLTERGDVEPVIRHENFRLFACMNPATDVGKKDLPVGIRNRFTELYVDELEEEKDLIVLITDYLQSLSLTAQQINGIVKFYLTVKEAAANKLTDGTGRKPHFSLRTLCRALKYAAPNPCCNVSRSLYEGFCLSFLTQLDRSSHPLVEKLVCQHVVGKSNIKAMLKQALPMPSGGKYLNFERYWISVGSERPCVPDHYIMTPSVRANLKDLVRVVSSGQHPVLLQGETSVGKTSLVTWLAQSTGNVCVRVNNHEHTDLQEYVGCYAADQTGKLTFMEGVLVEAMRKGHWIILDELNLAPSDVLEALNRLLDDNRELFIPETQEVVKAHPKFMLFATQNPPGQYGGRKFLSRAFRNRFVELHFDEIPSGELETILHKRCDIPLSYAKRLVATMLDLQTRRRGSGVFAGKQGFMTLRDLFRWAQRYKCQNLTVNETFYDWDQHMAEHGYMILAGRVRKEEEMLVVQNCIQKHFKRSLDPEKLFSLTPETSNTVIKILQSVTSQSASDFKHIVWTYGMRRLAVLIGQALQFNEPILLVGETGCGKTTVCQLYSSLYESKLHSINCHLHTESADFLGGLRPCRSHEEGTSLENQALFEWVDGPLVKAMREGSMFLIDEISLADDSVLERLNSVLEPERRLLLAEKGGGNGSGQEVDLITATEGFQVFATMNPGGDFGKKELSPALRNRFTEIWCPQTNNRQDLIAIIEHNLKSGIHLCNQEDGTSGIGRAIMDFVEWFVNNEVGKKCVVSIRDILFWVHFINACSSTLECNELGAVSMETDSEICLLDPAVALIHGACLVFLDGLGAGATSRGRDTEIEHTRNTAIKYLLQLVNHMTHLSYDLKSVGLLDKNATDSQSVVRVTEGELIIWPFSISKGFASSLPSSGYALEAPTTCVNAQRILRALQLPRPLLLEGSPGVGKTSLVSAIARVCGRELVRINLSEQTDVTDLFGADLPVEGEEGGVFAWRDGPLLRALKEGQWIVLDELNLASQSVLEGLNACLDHRAEIYVPELGKTFRIQHEKTRLFACQNPLNQGGGRKGLPKSFLNRFTQVYVEQLSFSDQLFIAQTMYPSISTDLLTCMVKFNMEMHHETMVECSWGQKGGPWEFNLRDLFRWCDLLLANQSPDNLNPGEYVSILYTDRFRTLSDKQKVSAIYQRVFQMSDPPYHSSKMVHISKSHLQVGHSFIKREAHMGPTCSSGLHILHHSIVPLESVIKCVEMKWMSILIGPQSCGKTSLVQLLSYLTGRKLHVLAMNSAMDTTELLGGFEQSDLGRHLEELTSNVYNIMRDLETHLILKHDLQTVQTLEAGYKEVMNIGDTNERMSSAEELQQRRLKFTHLQQLFNMCSQLSQKLDISYLMSSIGSLGIQFKKLDISLQKAKPGSGGGAFEWIDSLLVQALKSGDWLLVDNVNFCNASVLDRLNALLEPDGELSINERGIIDGQIQTVKPHPDFRLFLAMDPKFGEISRAMRNRGVEIYITGEDEGTPYDSHDVKVMIQTTGIGHENAADWLISLHNILQQILPRGERPSILELLQTALITKQQIDRGVSLVKALESSSYDVFVKNMKSSSTRKSAKEIWFKHCENLESVLDQENIETSILNTASCREMTDNSLLANLRKSGKLFTHYLHKICSMTHSSKDIKVLSPMIRRLRHSGMLLLNSTSQYDWAVCYPWIQSTIEQFAKLVNSEKSRLLTNILSDYKFVMKCTMETVQKSMKQDDLASAECQRLLLEGPVDGRWNLQNLHKVLHTIGKENRMDMTRKLDHMFNRVHLMTLVAAEYYSYSKSCQQINSHLVGVDRRMMKLPVIADINKLLHSSDILLTLYQDIHIESFTHLMQMVQSFVWWTRLIETVLDCIEHHQFDDNRLRLYWDWCYNKVIQPLTSLIPTELNSIITHICQVLGEDNKYGKLFLKFWKTCGHPQPFRSKAEAEMVLTLCELSQCASVQRDVANLKSVAIVKLLTEEGSRLTKILMQLYEMSKESSPERQGQFHILLQSGRELLQKYGLINTHQDVEMGSTQSELSKDIDLAVSAVASSEPCQIVELWPLFENITLLANLDYTVNFMRDESKEAVLISQSFVNYALQFTPSSATQLVPFNILVTSAESREKKIEALQEMMQSLYSQAWNSTVSCHTNRWLSWKPHMEDYEDGITDITLGPVSHHKPMLSYLTFSYLCGESACQSKIGDLQPLQIPLGEHRRQDQKFQLISSHLWCHAALYSSDTCSPRNMEKTHLLQVFMQLLHTMRVLLPTDSQSSFLEELHQLHQIVYTCPPVNTEQQLKRVWENFQMIMDESFQSILRECFNCIAAVLGTKSDLSDRTLAILRMGCAWVYVGLVQRRLLTPCVPVDPVEKVYIRLQHLQEECDNIDQELEVRNEYNKMMTGDDLSGIPECLLHPHIQYLYQRKLEIQLKIESLRRQQAYRPQISQFQRLSTEIQNYLKSIGSEMNTIGLLKKLHHVCETVVRGNELTEERMWQKSQSAFLQGLEDNYPHYRDLVVPFCISVHQIKRGMRLVAMVTEEKQEECLLQSTSQHDLQNLLMKLAKFPSVTDHQHTGLDLVEDLNSEHVHNLIKVICQRSAEGQEQSADPKLLIARLNDCLLTLTANHALIRRKISPEILYSLSHLLQQFLSAWQHQEEEKKRKEAESSLYKFKTKVHGDERDQDLIEEDEFQENFPSYHKDFQDVIGTQSLEEKIVVDEKETNFNEEDSGIITDDMIQHVCHVHHDLFTSLTSANWIKPELKKDVTTKDVVIHALQSYMLTAALFRNCFMVMANDLDPHLIGAHLLTSKELQQQIHNYGDQGHHKDMQGKSYDIYRDPNIQEVIRCPAVLEHLVAKVTELQKEWPDHPTLKQIIEIVRRILSFPLTSPVIKYLTGLELLLEKAQEWESNAARHVSIATELGEISLLIMEWRKLELNCWNQCLDVVQQKQSQNASKWWFFLFQLIQSESEDNQNSDEEMRKTLKSFMEESCLGEFEARLNMLKGFHCHLIHMETSSNDLVNFFWNMYQFYNQFTHIVKDKILQLRTPIEKELKGFVKIARWTDMNYWALKQSTEKTHRTLHKHMKAFKSVLEQPVKGILSEEDPSLQSKSEEILPWRDQYQSTLNIISHVPSITTLTEARVISSDLPLQSKLNSLIVKASKHWNTLTSQRHTYDKHVITLDEFTGEVIETTQELQALQVTEGAEKEKQRSEAKHIGLRKRKALSDLFKYLTHVGLSHRKGLIMYSNTVADLPLLAKPLDLSALFSQARGVRESESQTGIWEACREYYFKCIARKAKFSTALQTPSKELGVGNIERCKGFLEHLSTLMLGQYSNLADISCHWKEFREFLLSVEKMKMFSVQPPQSELHSWMKRVQTLCVSLIEGLHQSAVVLESCPQGIAGEPYPSPYPSHDLCKMAMVRYGDEQWTTCKQSIEEMLKQASILYSEIMPLETHLLVTWDDVDIIFRTLQHLATFTSKFTDLEKLFQNPRDASLSPLTETLTFLKNFIISTNTEFIEWKQTCENQRECQDELNRKSNSSVEMQEFGRGVEDLISSLLMVIQTLNKSEVRKEKPTETDENDDVFDEKQLAVKLDERLTEDIQNLQYEKISSKLKDLFNKLIVMWDSSSSPDDSRACSSLLVQCLPLLCQYCHILEYYLLQIMACHRMFSKMLSVLLGLFTELVSKGFCTPAEFEDEVGGEGATEFEDIEGGGMGEGEGTKDVSDQIENEDQLDEAQKPGEKKEEDTTNRPDIRSEENAIEMSEDFDGKMQDLEEADVKEGSEDEEGEEEVDKQMGDVDDNDTDKLDDRMWGEDEDDPQEQEKNEKEEFGPGSEQEEKSELVANEDNKDQSEGKDGKRKEEQNEENEEEDNKINQKDIFDENECDDDRIDPSAQQKPDQQPEAMDLPDDLNLDEEEADKDEEGQGQDDDHPNVEEETGDKDSEDTKEEIEQEGELEQIPEMEHEGNDSGKEEDNQDTKDADKAEDANETDQPNAIDTEEEGTNDNSQEGEEASDETQAMHAGTTSHDAQNVEKSDMSQDQGGDGDNEQEESDGVGQSQFEMSEGHEGQSSSKVTVGSAQQQNKPLKRKPGKSDADRSLGSTEQKYKRLKTTDQSTTEQEDAGEEKMETDLYEHIKDPSSKHDAQTLDTATGEQQEEQPLPNKDMEEGQSPDEQDMEMDQDEQNKDSDDTADALQSAELKLRDHKKQQKFDEEGTADESEDIEGMKHEIDGEVIETMSAARKPESTIHTTLENLFIEKAEFDLEKLRAELEEQLSTFTQADNTSLESEAVAAEAWHRYEALTSTLSQELCEQLRLVLEPSQATKLRGDYRTGKRLNMRKVIPYIASQFRKDKIWLRRTKPSKRQYQVMLAIDDSSSMVDNHSKQLAYESLALLANGLMLLEVGELAICSFGENVKLLHPFTEQFTSQSGARLLQHLTFQQKKTKIAQLLKQATVHMTEASTSQHGMMGNPDTSQLLLIVSDGRGLFVEGMETVKSAVRKAREANIFLVFVIIDSPHNKDSILDIRVPVFKSATQIPEIKSYMDHFPFPFYIILRDINNLPEVMSDSLRQWFEMVTAGDR